MHVLISNLFLFVCLFVCFQIFDGNTDSDSVVTAMFSSPVPATLIRIQPTDWEKHPCMRFELLGCQGRALIGLLQNIDFLC